MKQSYYFPHDYHARHDPKLEKLRMELGPISDGIFWDLVEMLYEENGYLSVKDIPIYAKMLNTDEHMLNKVINELFLKDGDRFYNKSLLDRLEHLNDVIYKRQLAGEASGKARQKNKSGTSVEHLSNTIDKGDREIKEIDKGDIRTFSFEDFWNEYPKRVGMAMAIQTYLATIKTNKDHNDLMGALKNYMASDEVKKGMIMRGDNWIEDWKGWIRRAPKSQIRKPEPMPVKPKDVFKGGAKEDIEKVFKT